ncbi:MAG TPA: hypothetical protein DCE64_02175, partial [Planktomarina temperata]|nr:hypothetical protein [Planktomarina temperata]
HLQGDKETVFINV